jgi:hypothetical protein
MKTIKATIIKEMLTFVSMTVVDKGNEARGRIAFMFSKSS